MRSLKKLGCPAILAQNHHLWLQEYLDDRTNSTKKFRYRHKDIKETLKQETGFKCIYCESKIGHNTPGDVEHKIPSSKDEKLHFEWSNLTIACTECNRRKNAYYKQELSFLDPYTDDVENMIEHLEPLVTWVSGEQRAEVTVKILELNTHDRLPLIIRKVEELNSFFNLIERWKSEISEPLKSLLWKDIEAKINKSSEFSGMLLSTLKTKGLIREISTDESSVVNPDN